MARILRTDHDSNTESGRIIGPVFAKDIRYTNSSVKFWYGLIEEISKDYPDCNSIELSSIASGRLESELLFPELSLQRDLEKLAFTNLETEMKKTIAELEMFGPPSAVHVRLLSQATEIISRDLPLDIMDSEIFSSLIVWPLKWAEIPECQWNNETLEGNVRLEDRKHGQVCIMSFTLEKQHLSEGLFCRFFRIKHHMEPYSPTTKTAAP